jgi:hypothetical protein
LENRVVVVEVGLVFQGMHGEGSLEEAVRSFWLSLEDCLVWGRWFSVLFSGGDWKWF